MSNKSFCLEFIKFCHSINVDDDGSITESIRQYAKEFMTYARYRLQNTF